MEAGISMKKILLVLGVLVALVAGLAAFLLSIDVNQFRPQIEAQLQRSLKRTVTLGTVSLKIIPLAIGVDDVTIGESAALRSSRPFVTAKQIQVRAGLFALLQKRLDIQSLVLQQPAVELVRTERGKWNFSDIGGDSPGGGSGGGGSAALGLDELEIVDGRVAVTDLEARTPRAVYDHIDLTLSGYAPGKKFDLEAVARLPGSGTISVKGTGGPLPSTGFTGKASLKDASLASLRGFMGSEKLDADANISGEATLTSSGTATNINGNLTAKDVRYGDMKVPQAVEVEYRVVSDSQKKATQIPMLKVKSGDALINAALSVATAGASGNGTIQNLSLPVAALTQPIVLHNASFRLDPGALKLDNLRLSLAKTNLTGSAGIRNFDAPDLQFAADIDQVDYAEIQKLMAAESGSSKGSKSSGPSKVTGSGTVQIGTIKYNNLVLTNAKASCTLDHGLIKLSPISAQSSGGHITGDIQYDGRREPATIAVNTKLDRLDANQLLSSTTSLKDTIAGLLSGDTQAQFTSRPGEEITRTLNGTVKFQLTDGKLQRMNVLNEMASIGKFLGATKQSQPFTNIVKLAGSMVFRDGVGTTDDLKLDLDGGSVAAAGTVNLVDQTLNMRLTTVLSKEFSQRAGGNQIGGLMSTVLANPQGEMVIPATVTGTMSQPRFAPDAERFAQMKLKGLLPSASNPAGAVQSVKGLVDAFRGRKPTADQPGGAAQEKRPVDSILDLFKKKTDKPPQK